MQFNLVAVALSAFVASAMAAAPYGTNSTVPYPTGTAAPTGTGSPEGPTGTGGSPDSTGPPIADAGVMNRVSGSALGMVVIGGLALVSSPGSRISSPITSS
ncbi:MAG: hypothetical protein M1837_006830 [Sclerophora amabilis]|nr:MAG: hypothetical protein M1837_006830 [Sclerophora amabilis]